LLRNLLTFCCGTLGTYTVTVTAKDAEGVSGTATFVWSVVQ